MLFSIFCFLNLFFVMYKPKVAIVCDWLTNFGGAERVIEQIYKMFPDSPIYTSLYNSEKMGGFEEVDVRTSYLQKIPGAKSHHQLFLYCFPGAFESFDLSEFDIVISSSHSCAKGIITKPETLHICYCHSPMRYAWDESHSYIQSYPFNRLLKKIIPRFIHKLRMWDRLSAERVDAFVSNSSLVKRRIKKYYQKDSYVIHPPVDTEKWTLSVQEGDYYFAVGRMTPYKRFDLLVEAFNKLDLPLRLAGVGPEFERLKSMANSNIEFLGRISDEELLENYMGAKGFLFPQYEDFGITPLEAMSCGRPVIAFRGGGSLETVIEGKTGLFFDEQTVESLIAAVERFESKKWNYQKIREHAESFGNGRFQEELFDFIKDKWEMWQETMV